MSVKKRKTMKKYFTLLTLLSFFLSSFSNEPVAENGTITGRIIDNSSSQPVSFASVALVMPSDTAVVSGVITDDNGIFKIDNVPFGKYNLRISFIGYKTEWINDIEVSRQQKKIELMDMKLSEDITSLDEAVVVAERLKGEEKIDRTVFTLNDEIRKASSSGLSVLKHIPSVSVDFQENVSLEGQSNIQFYVDGVLRNKDFIAQLDPNSIDKVELITNPGVKYDADVSGIINIVLKKVKRYGVSGSVKVPVPHPTKVILDPNANIEYGNQDFRIYAGDRLHYERFEGSEIVTTRIDETFENPFYFEKIGKGINSWQNNYMNYGIDWFINEKTSLNFLGEWRNWKGVTDDYNTEDKTFENDNLTKFVKTQRNGLDRNNNYYFSLFLKKKFNQEGSEFTAEAYYNNQLGNIKNDYYDSFMSIDSPGLIEKEIIRNNVTNNQRSNAELKLNYTFLFKGIKNDLGVATLTSWMDNQFLNSYNSGESITQDEEFKYQENRPSAYYNLSGKVKKFSWQAGLRGEYSNLELNSESTSDYLVLLPQFNLSQGFNKEQSVKFSFRRQIFRPSAGNLNPFEVWSDSLHVRRGNPDLKPAIENRFELTYSKNFKSNFVSPKIYYRYTSNGIQDVSRITGEGITELVQDNVGKNSELGVSVNSTFQVFKPVKFNSNISVFNRIYETEGIRDEKISYRFNFSSIVSLPKNFNFTVFGNYGSPNITYQRVFSRDLLILVGLQKKIGEKMNIDMFYNPFIKDFKYMGIETTTSGYYETWEGHINVLHIFAIEFTYRFNYGKSIKKINRSAEYEKEEGRGSL